MKMLLMHTLYYMILSTPTMARIKGTLDGDLTDRLHLRSAE
jgi:hypothetical protein